MQGLNKTKAALQGRQCNYKKLKPSQITTLIDQVNNLGRVKGCNKKCIGYKLTAPLAQLIRDTRKFPHTGNSTYLKSLATWWVSPKLDRPIYTQPIGVCLLPLWGSMAMADTQRRNSGLAEGEIPPSKQNQSVSFAFFRCSVLSLRPQASSTHDEKFTPGLSSFSRSTLASILSSISCGKRMFLSCDLLFLFPVAIGKPVVNALCVYTQYMNVKVKKSVDLSTHHELRYLHTSFIGVVQIAKPGSGGTLTGPLTTNDRMSIEVAMLNHTQTRPKYQYRFLALHRSDRSAAPCRLSVEAFTEKEARQVLSAHFILSLAARLPVSEVRHA
ncbi:Uncharacterised protein [Yersinia pseudotuberculosis]|nr:Uncharacterised protein [Yersinia pseudotuberculosis]